MCVRRSERIRYIDTCKLCLIKCTLDIRFAFFSSHFSFIRLLRHTDVEKKEAAKKYNIHAGFILHNFSRAYFFFVVRSFVHSCFLMMRHKLSILRSEYESKRKERNIFPRLGNTNYSKCFSQKNRWLNQNFNTQTQWNEQMSKSFAFVDFVFLSFFLLLSLILSQKLWFDKTQKKAAENEQNYFN